MSRYFRTPTAQADLVNIRNYYLDEAGNRIARQTVNEFIAAFRFLSRNPGAGHKREDRAANARVAE
jgi:plasmid stabilization system protein ParE